MDGQGKFFSNWVDGTVKEKLTARQSVLGSSVLFSKDLGGRCLFEKSSPCFYNFSS